jgi:amino acid transporter
VPFGTSTLATFVTKSDSQSHLAAALFAALLVFMGLTLAALNRMILARVGIEPAPGRDLRTRLRSLTPWLGGTVNLAGIGVAFISPIAVLCMTGAVAFFYFLESMQSDHAC